MTSLPEFQRTDPIADITSALLDAGGVIVHKMLNDTTLTQLNTELDSLLTTAVTEIKGINPAVQAFFGDKVRHVSGMPGKSIVFAEDVMCHPLYLALCDEILLPHCADYILNLGHVMDRGAGAEQQWLHGVVDVWVHCPRPHPEIQLASVLAMVDFSKENGATCLVPGSHKWEKDREAKEAECAYAEMPAGSAVIYLGSTIHGGGTNTTEGWRRGLHISYCHGWLRTEENNLLAVPPHKARELSSRAQQLLGYGVHDAIDHAGGYLGMLDMRNPQELLETL